jgi:hypothetical protein
MHLVEQHIFEMAQEGATLTKEEQLHLQQCEDCGNLFRLFVLKRFYTKRTIEKSCVECLSAR